MAEKPECACGGKPTLVFCCSGASDAGFKKGHTPVTPEAVEAMAAKARSILASSKGRE